MPWYDVETIKEVPIWAFHGDQDGTIPADFSRIAFEDLTKIGGNMKYTEYAGVGHGVDGFAFNHTGDKPKQGFVTKYSSDKCDRTEDVWNWLFSQRRGN